jgi:hypothetical protein
MANLNNYTIASVYLRKALEHYGSNDRSYWASVIANLELRASETPFVYTKTQYQSPNDWGKAADWLLSGGDWTAKGTTRDGQYWMEAYCRLRDEARLHVKTIC